MIIDKDILTKFEKQLNPLHINTSAFKAKLIGYGEISVIFELADTPGVIYKRMPMFSNYATAKKYVEKYQTYCSYLKNAGIKLPKDATIIIEKSKTLTVLYIAQEKFNAQTLGNIIINNLDKKEIEHFAQKILKAIYGVWQFNKQNKEVDLAIDSQISNWVYLKETDTLIYIDTSTPIFKIGGIEQMDPELILTSAPSFARAIIRKFFLADVMDRYYDEKSVNIDLIANLYKEQKPQHIPLFIKIANTFSTEKISEKEIKSYYKEDKFIWQLFLNMRRLDRWLYKYVYKKQYEFILPGKIKR